MQTGAPAVLESGDVLAGRYRLDRRVAGRGPAALWRATDVVLARPVAVKLLPAPGAQARQDAQPFLLAAGRASGLAHPGLARVYDAALEERSSAEGGSEDVAYVVSEWVEGRDLTGVLADGPLEPGEAAALAAEAAEAVAAAHARGIGHGRLHPGNVLLTAARRVRVTDVAVAAVLAGRRPGPDGLTATELAEDTRDLSALLYAMLTARWPGELTPQPARGVAPAPHSGGRTCSARQVRAAVPRDLDAVLARGLEPDRPGTMRPTTTAPALAGALAPFAAAEQKRPAAERLPRPPSRLRRSLPWVAALVFLTAVGTATYAAGRAVGGLPRRPGDVNELTAPTTTPSPGASGPTRRLDLASLAMVRDYDPSGDGAENPDQVVNAYDGDTSTAWLTSTYRTARLGGLKPGVGLLVDLQRPTAVGRVDVGLVTPGAGVELRAGDSLGSTAEGLRLVAGNAGSGQLARLTPGSPTTARYWLIWFTSLPREGKGYREGVTELAFRT